MAIDPNVPVVSSNSALGFSNDINNIGQEFQQSLANRNVMNDSMKEFYELTGLNPNSGSANKEKYVNWILSEHSANTAREWTAKREDSAYQRLVTDLRSAGINPMIIAHGGNPISSSSQGVNYQGSQMTSAQTSRESNITKLILGLLGLGAMFMRFA